MARSFQRTPISGNCSVRSDKWFKRQAAGRLRVAVRGALRTGRHEILPQTREIAAAWDSGKDGKRWFGDLPRERRRRLMKHLAKGDGVAIHGELRVSTYKDKERMELIAQSADFFRKSR
ncbi:MAG: hypothetical protein GY938_15905 [Ketobacter sp.]|nr:hypothetical protein [Ketobacter sp.]